MIYQCSCETTTCYSDGDAPTDADGGLPFCHSCETRVALVE